MDYGNNNATALTWRSTSLTTTTTNLILTWRSVSLAVKVGVPGQKTTTLCLATSKRHSIIDHVQLGLNYVSSFQFCPRMTTILDLQLTQEH